MNAHGAAMNTPVQPTFFITHGGGPCFFMDWSPIGPADSWNRLGEWLRALPATLPARPAAVVVVSAHWEAPLFSITADPRPELIFDYHGFPEHTYRLQYPAPGAPALAGEVRALLAGAGLAAAEVLGRGYDHGVFVPFKLVFPDADVPIVQLSLRADLGPAVHLQAGRALAPLRSRNVLIVGSGSSYHNLRRFGAAGGAASEQFDAWLTATVTAADAAGREQGLAHWAEAPAARQAHPREEHLLPLMVAAGAAGTDRGERVFTDRIMGVRLSNYRFG
ncbi:MAG: dioxygenase [Nevskia sp.]|nr:dioxygenase [Nevskia sp.]